MRLLRFNRVYQGDARTLAARLPRSTIAVTLTSPPYWSLKDYQVPNQIGWGQDYAAYMNDLTSIFRSVHRATRDDGSLWIVIDTVKAGGQLRLLPFELAERLRAGAGWILRDVVIWDKAKTLPWSAPGRLRNQFEYLLCFSKSRHFRYEIDRLKEITLKEWWVRFPERYSPRGKVPTNIWRIPIPVQGSWSSNGLRHACPFPTLLVERILLLTTDRVRSDIVLDPFSGSGTVSALAEQMGRGFIGFELNPESIRMYRGTVRPVIRKEWALRRQHLRRLARQRALLEARILNLRVLKYPKAILAQLKRTPAQTRLFNTVSAVLAVAKTDDRLPVPDQPKKSLVAVALLFVLRDRSHERRLLGKISRFVSMPPLSKFGLTVDVKTVAFADLDAFCRRSGWSRRMRLWLYRNGRVYRQQDRTTVARLVARLLSDPSGRTRHSFPPILSNVRAEERPGPLHLPDRER